MEGWTWKALWNEVPFRFGKNFKIWQRMHQYYYRNEFKWQTCHLNMTCAPNKDSDQSGHPPSLIKGFAVCSMGSWGPNVSSCGQWRLIRLDERPGRSEFAGRRSFCRFCHEAALLYRQVYANSVHPVWSGSPLLITPSFGYITLW